MKKLAAVLGIMVFFFSPLWAQIDPCTQTTQLTGGTDLQWSTSSHQGMGNLSGSGYHYEVWIEGGTASDQQLKWYGANQGGGAAFYAKWKNPDDYLGRIGYYWGGSNGPAYSTLNNVYVDFNYKRSGNNTAGDYSYIGVYGWARNPNASNNEKLVEYYVVEDWFGNQWQNQSTPVNGNTIMSDQSNKNPMADFTVDGSVYDIYKKVRTGPSVDGNKTFTQIFSVRRDQRKCGTISVNEHVNKWNELGGLTFANMYDLKFLAEAGGGEGWLDLSYLKLSQEQDPRGSTPAGSSSSTGTSGTSSSSATQATTCQTPLITYPTTTVPADPYTACFQYTNGKCYVCKIESEGEFEGNINTCASSWVWDGTQIDNNLKDGYWYYEVTCPSTPIRVLHTVPLKFRVRSLNNGTLNIESNSDAVIYLYNTKGKMVQKIDVPIGSSIVKTIVPTGIYIVKNSKTKEKQRIMVR